tara:strand:+ start:571 stop:675 length:105 start_codon:yes stop_codon:yes gene_type:complete
MGKRKKNNNPILLIVEYLRDISETTIIQKIIIDK